MSHLQGRVPEVLQRRKLEDLSPSKWKSFLECHQDTAWETRKQVYLKINLIFKNGEERPEEEEDGHLLEENCEVPTAKMLCSVQCFGARAHRLWATDLVPWTGWSVALPSPSLSLSPCYPLML